MSEGFCGGSLRLGVGAQSLGGGGGGGGGGLTAGGGGAGGAGRSNPCWATSPPYPPEYG